MEISARMGSAKSDTQEGTGVVVDFGREVRVRVTVGVAVEDGITVLVTVGMTVLVEAGLTKRPLIRGASKIPKTIITTPLKIPRIVLTVLDERLTRGAAVFFACLRVAYST